MYYKIRNDVLFRKYQGHGYITDNSEYGYRMLNDARIYPGEKYVSASGAVMLSMLSKSPRAIDDIVGDLSQIFTGVEYETLKQDTIEFFDWFVDEGFLSCGKTVDTCTDRFVADILSRTIAIRLKMVWQEVTALVEKSVQMIFLEASISRLLMHAMSVAYIAIFQMNAKTTRLIPPCFIDSSRKGGR